MFMWTRKEVDTNAKHTEGKGTIEELKVSLNSNYHVITADKSLVRHHWLLAFDKANDDTSPLHPTGQAVSQGYYLTWQKPFLKRCI